MKRRLICALALLLIAVMVLPLASCGKPNVEQFVGNYTYKDSVTTLSANWNPHTYQTSDESYPISFLTSGLYSFIYNDELNPVDGKDPYAGYVIVPEMAAAMPKDVTEKVKKDYPQFNIPESADKGYAYEIKLNKDAVWEDGTPINADTYVYSMKALLDPIMKNYRAVDQFGAATLSFAGAENYHYQGQTIITDNYVSGNYTKADLTKGSDGVYVNEDGLKMYVNVNYDNEYLGDPLKAYVDAYGDQYFDTSRWDELVALMDEDGLVPLTDETYEMILTTVTGNPNWGEDESYIPNYLAFVKTYADNVSFEDTVGVIKTGEYEITIVLDKALAGFQLLYNLSGNWIVYEDLYESCKKQIDGTDAWTTTYNTSKETTMSYGPYKLVDYQADKSMRFEKNETWYGYTDGEHIYTDPTDGKTYPMYQTTAIDCQVVAEASTRKLMFLKGELMGYGLQSEDFEEYRDSEYCYVTPSETIFFFIFNGYMDAIEDREAKDDFDTTKFDLQTMTLQSFRKAVAVTYDKEALCTAVSPSRSGGYGLFGNSYIYDPDTGARYRDTDQAKKALCDFYSVDVSKFESLDEAAASITGYDPVTAKQLYTQAYNEALEAGYITDADGDGKSDQAIEIIYASSATSSFITKTLDYLNVKMAEVLVGTPFEGKISFKESAPMGNDWSKNLKAGLADTCLAGWSGSALNPYGLTEVYVNPAQQYDAKWFNAAATDMTLEVNVAGIDAKKPQMETVTMSVKDWSDALNGVAVEKDGKTYNFGDGIADVETRLDIFAAFESTILSTYNYIPMLQDAGMSLLSQQVYYVVEEYNPIMGRGGIQYMKYNYDDAAWAEYVASQANGQLSY